MPSRCWQHETVTMMSVVYVCGWGQRVAEDVPQEISNWSGFVHGSECSIDCSLCVGGKGLKCRVFRGKMITTEWP